MPFVPRFPSALIGIVLVLAALPGTPGAAAADKPRARDLGIPFDGQPGPRNAITDVAGTPSIAALESSYADWLDAVSAVATIDAGATTQVDGAKREVWEARQAALRASLPVGLAQLDAHRLAPDDRRALSAMQKGLVENAADQADSAVTGQCADARTSDAVADAGALQVALYACFETLGNHVAFEGATLARTTALDRLQQLDEEARRERLFYAFAPLWAAVDGGGSTSSPYRRMLRSVAAQPTGSARSPIAAAATTVGIDSQQTERWLVAVLDTWRRRVRAPEVEPWNFWYANAAASRTLRTSLPRRAVLPIALRFYRDLGVDLEALGVQHDLDTRPGKAPLAYADHVRIGRVVNEVWRPAIPRISANYEQGGLFVINELIHEEGHAAHDAAIRARPAFYSLGDDLFVEAFADVTAWSTAAPVWQQRYLGRSTAAPAAQRELFSNVMLDVAWGLFELRMLHDSSADPNHVWTDITARYLRIKPHPEIAWWALRVQLVRWPGYMINYGLGAILTADLRARIRAAIGPFDGGNARWYPFVSAQLLQFGGAVDTPALLQRFLGRPVSERALLHQLARLQP